MSRETLPPNETVFNNTAQSITECIELIKTYGINKEELLSSVKNTTKRLCESQLNYKRSSQAIENTKKYFNDDKNKDSTVNCHEIYERELNQLDLPSNSEEHELYKQVAALIDGHTASNSQSADSAGPSADAFNQSADSSDIGDNSIICTSTMTQPDDPITKGPILKPCKNTICKHMYDFNSIQVYIKSRRKGKAACPYVGCINKNISMGYIELCDALPNKSIKNNLNVLDINN